MLGWKSRTWKSKTCEDWDPREKLRQQSKVRHHDVRDVRVLDILWHI
jgi:hypothetical protein